MKRDIKFRGKDHQGRWHFGDLRHTMMELGRPHCRIVNVDEDQYGRLQEKWSNLIDEDTVGQFTGLMDANEKPIYEDDIVCLYHEGHCSYKGVVKYQCCQFLACGNNGLSTVLSRKPWLIVGNTHDNPEMMEGGVK